LLAAQELMWLGRSIIEKDCRIDSSCDDEKHIGCERILIFYYILLIELREEFHN
jgi:hypothetical protein